MKKELIIFFSLALTVIPVLRGAASAINWKKSKPYLTKFSIEGRGKDQVFSFASIPGKNKKPTKIWYVTVPWKIGKTNTDGISFEVKGDGSKYFATIFMGYSKWLQNGYEASFPLSSQKWQKVIIPFEDFIQNDKPWGVRGEMTQDTVKFNPAKVNYIGFGRGNNFHKFYPASCSFKIRNISLVKDIPAKKLTSFSKGLSRTLSIIKKKEPLKILLLGDSITDFGKDKSYAFYCGQLMKKTFGNTVKVANCGIGGHSVRAGAIVLPRSMRTMPAPDLVCIFYGANDCKAATAKIGFNAKTFKMQISKLIDEVREATNGKADILLINGVPRLTKDKSASTGAVEKIVGAVKDAAKEKHTAFLDTFDVYLKLPPKERVKYYRDTIHQNDKGLRFIGNLMFNAITKTK